MLKQFYLDSWVHTSTVGTLVQRTRLVSFLIVSFKDPEPTMLVNQGKILCVLGPILNKNKNTIVNRQVLYLAFVAARWCMRDY